MILPFPHSFPEDATERAIPDVVRARALLAEKAPAFGLALARRSETLARLAGPAEAGLIARCNDAVSLAYARLAHRHGSWGEDFHAYHNEHHILEIFDSRIARLMNEVGATALSVHDWLLLGLFAACHDLRQRERADYCAGVGSNERASIEEGLRILTLCGFDPDNDDDFFIGLELMIAGSTFDARPASALAWEYNSVDLLQSGGALASKLDAKLDKHAAGWRLSPAIAHALDLATIAADLDTANVAEPFAQFVETGMRLCLEREMRCHRSVDDPGSALPVLGFLTDGQERFFFELHRFNSEAGRRTFSAAKAANAAPLLALTMALRDRVERFGQPGSGAQVIAELRALTHRIAADAT
ncbi:hypothetical protein [Tahibacter amnicola]|uniref:Uncharacterized protein n=1 Tax=Tahibacter amnicola TaxID=2976241 RepID=A0ABY6BDZ6_9GAMM|nr:hypothetical protein [Tahibacter amnicola]UXI68254.1 hypothetical protein N4264_00985 [Tahibacter amnicola]